MSTQKTKFHVREADSSLGDDQFILAAFDSAIAYLASIGSHEMWGVTPFTKQDGWTAETLQQINDAETYRLTGKGKDEGESEGVLRVFIVDAEFPIEVQDNNSSSSGSGTPGDRFGTDAAAAIDVQQQQQQQPQQRHELPKARKEVLPVGFAFVREDRVPKYIASQDHLGRLGGKSHNDADWNSCLYVEVMVTDHSVSNSILRKGAGAALLQGIKEHAQRTQRRALLVDAWAGNDRKLIRSELPDPPPLGLLPVKACWASGGKKAYCMSASKTKYIHAVTIRGKDFRW